MARHQTRPLIVFLLVLFACVAAPAARAHVVSATSAPSTAATDIVSGIVDALVVEDRVHNVTVTYPLLLQDDGTVVPLVGTEAGALTRGSRVGIVGRWDRFQFEVAQAQTLVERAAPTAPTTSSQVTGTLFIAHADDFASGQSRFIHQVREDSGSVTTLELAALPAMLRGGMRISVSGQVGSAPRSLRPQAITILSGPAAPSGPASSSGSPLSVTTNNVLVIMANFNNTVAPAFTQAQALAVMTTNASSVSNFYKEMSYGQQQLNVTVTANWVTMNMARPSTCDFSSIQTAADAAATKAGYIVPAWPGFVVYLFPNLSSCGWSGLAYVSSPHWAFINGTAAFGTLVVSHEMGHNFGLLHAGSLNCGVAVIGGSCGVAEYGDPWDTMGNQRAMHFNAYQKSEISFIASSALKTHSSGTASYTLTPLEQSGGALYGVLVPTANTNRTYVLEFRQPIGFDAALSSYPNLGAQIRVVNPFEWSSGADDTEILDMTPGSASGFLDSALTVGNTYNDGPYGVSITVTSATSSALTVSITKSSGAATSTTLTSSANPSNPGANVALTATVTGTSPTGTVNFLDGLASIGGCSAISLSGSGNTRTAACSTINLTVGTHNITAVYSGDGTNAGSTSNAVSQVVSGTPSTTTLATSLTPSTVGTNVTFTATVTATSPTGPMTFKDGASSIAGCSAVPLAGKGNVRTAKCPTASLTVGTHNITAVYAGDLTNSGSTSGVLTQVVNASSTSQTKTTLASSRNPAGRTASVTFTASVTGNSPSGSVGFKSNGGTISGCAAVALQGLGNTKTAACTTIFGVNGSYSIVASYGGDAGNPASTSTALVETVSRK
jgi:hypothetical protein